MKATHDNNTGIYKIEADFKELSHLQMLLRVAWLASLHQSGEAGNKNNKSEAQRLWKEAAAIYDFAQRLNPSYIEFEQATDISKKL